MLKFPIIIPSHLGQLSVKYTPLPVAAVETLRVGYFLIFVDFYICSHFQVGVISVGQFTAQSRPALAKVDSRGSLEKTSPQDPLADAWNDVHSPSSTGSQPHTPATGSQPHTPATGSPFNTQPHTPTHSSQSSIGSPVNAPTRSAPSVPQSAAPVSQPSPAAPQCAPAAPEPRKVSPPQSNTVSPTGSSTISPPPVVVRTPMLSICDCTVRGDCNSM